MNKEQFIKELKEKIYDECFNEIINDNIKDIDEIHDIGLSIVINGKRIEEDKDLYEKMVNILEKDGEEILAEINDYIDDECQSYYGDPAFSSASDYWNYILG